eukprot:Pgem_evm1s9451
MLFVYLLIGRLLIKSKIIPTYHVNSISILLTQYSVTGIVYVLQLIPYTIIFFYLMFTDRFDLVATWAVNFVIAFILTHAVMFSIDVAVRVDTKTNKVLIIHHLLWFVGLSLPLLTKDVFGMKLGLIADYFTVFEFGLFYLLFSSKNQNRKLKQYQIYFGRGSVIVFILTRLVQIIMMVYLMVKSYYKMNTFNRQYLFWVLSCIMFLVNLSQFYCVYQFLQWDNIWNSS